MSQGSEGYVAVPALPSGTKIRNVSFTLPQPDGTMQTTSAQAIVLIDPQTGALVRPITFDQAKEMIALLNKLVSK